MITADDVQYHDPEDQDFEWGESNFFAFYVPERQLCGSIYVVARRSLGVAMGHVALFDRLSMDPKQMLYLDSRQHMPAPDRLDDYTLANGISIKATRPPLDYKVAYRSEHVDIDLDFKALMPPYDIHDESVDPNAAANRGRVGDDFVIKPYNGHFDMSGHVTGELRLQGESIEIDCVDTMDHSWGRRPEHHLPMISWLHAHFGTDYAVHLILMVDPTAPIDRQYDFQRGYVMDDGKVVGIRTATVTAIRTADLVGVALDISFVDDLGRTRKLTSGAVSGTSVPWYSCMEIPYIFHRWMLDDGRVGYGCVQEGYPYDKIIPSMR